MLKAKQYSRVVLVVLDGFGIASPSRGNAIFNAGTPNLDRLVSSFPSTTLQASGPLVGLPWGEMGNSEVGHLNIGAGRIVAQDLPRINNAIQTREFFSNEALVGACEHAKKNNSSLHIMGLASFGGVHASMDHLYALLGLAEMQQVPRVYIHMFLDGRDTGERVALNDLAKLRQKIAETGVGEIATVTGRFYAMDRGGHWDQTANTFRAMVEGQGPESPSAETAIESYYNRAIYDEMIPPTVIVKPDGQPVGKISDSDAVIFFNFRQDRALQMTQAFVELERTPLAGQIRSLQNIYFATMVEYRQHLPVHIAFSTQELADNLAEYLASRGLTQFHAAESEKYAHVTSFFNCGRSDPLPGEERKIVKSPSNTNNYSDHPEMAAPLLTEVLVEHITKTNVNFIVANYANADMVGHTGNMESSQLAVKSIDESIGKVAEAALQADAVLIITADHGNIEQLINPKTGEIDKDHTTNPVPCIVIANEFLLARPDRPNYSALSTIVPEGAISDIAPTIVALFGLPKPEKMTGISLLDALK